MMQAYLKIGFCAAAILVSGGSLLALIIFMAIRCRREMMRKNRVLIREMRENQRLEKELENAIMEKATLYKFLNILLGTKDNDNDKL